MSLGLGVLGEQHPAVCFEDYGDLTTITVGGPKSWRPQHNAQVAGGGAKAWRFFGVAWSFPKQVFACPCSDDASPFGRANRRRRRAMQAGRRTPPDGGTEGDGRVPGVARTRRYMKVQTGVVVEAGPRQSWRFRAGR